MRFLSASLICGLMAVLTACSHGGSTASTPAPLPDLVSPSIGQAAELGESTRRESGGARWASPTSAAPSDMPIAEKFWAPMLLAGELEKASIPEQRLDFWSDQESYVAECMKRSGFVYFPRSYSSEPMSDEEAAHNATLHRDNLPIPYLDSDREVVATLGYGALSASRASAQSPADSENEAYYSSLSTSQREAYDSAMGAPREGADAGGQLPMSGCRWEAQQKYPDPYPTDAAGIQFADLGVGVANLGTFPPIEADRRIVKLNAEWRSCMTRRGASVDVYQEHATEPNMMDGPMAAMDLAFQPSTDGEIAGADNPTDESGAASASHIKIALADFDCRRDTRYMDRFVEVQRELEEDFVRSNQKRFDELAAYVAQLQG